MSRKRPAFVFQTTFAEQVRRCSEIRKSPIVRLETFAFGFVGVTGFEPATTRPPDVYSNRTELRPDYLLRGLGAKHPKLGAEHPKTEYRVFDFSRSAPPRFAARTAEDRRLPRFGSANITTFLQSQAIFRLFFRNTPRERPAASVRSAAVPPRGQAEPSVSPFSGSPQSVRPASDTTHTIRHRIPDASRPVRTASPTSSFGRIRRAAARPRQPT